MASAWDPRLDPELPLAEPDALGPPGSLLPRVHLDNHEPRLGRTATSWLDYLKTRPTFATRPSVLR